MNSMHMRRAAMILLAVALPHLSSADLLAPWSASEGLRFDAAVSFRDGAWGERQWLLIRTWVIGDEFRIAAGEFGPDWNASRIPTIYPMELTLNMRNGTLDATHWGRGGARVEFRLADDIPVARPWLALKSPDYLAPVIQAIGVLRGGGIPLPLVRDAVERAATAGRDAAWTPTGRRSGELFQVRVDETGLLKALAVRDGQSISRRYQYVYGGSYANKTIERIRFEMGGEGTLRFHEAPRTESELFAHGVESPQLMDRHFGGWRGELGFCDVLLNDTTHRLPCSLDVRLVDTDAPLAEVRMHRHALLPASITADALDAEVAGYAFLSDLERKARALFGRHYLVATEALTPADREELDELLNALEGVASAPPEPIQGLRAKRHALDLAAILGDYDRAAAHLAAHLAAVGAEFGKGAKLESGVEYLRWILRRQDAALFNALLPLWLDVAVPRGDWHRVCHHALDLAHSDRFWAAQAIARRVIDDESAPPEWRVRHRAISAWCEHIVASYRSPSPELGRLWDDISPDVAALPKATLAQRARDSLRDAITAYRGLPNPSAFDREMIAILENPPNVSRYRESMSAR